MARKRLMERLMWPYVIGEKESPLFEADEDGPETADRLYLDILVRRADRQISQVDALDAKAASMFATGSTILPVTLGIYSIARNNINQVPIWAAFFILVSIAAYAGSAGVFVAGYWPKPWDSRPALWQWARAFRTDNIQSLESINAWLGNSLRDSIKQNNRQIDHKIKLAKWAVILLVVEVSCLIAVVVLPLF